jgi:hypothetical protein
MRAWAALTSLAIGAVAGTSAAGAHCYQGDCQAGQYTQAPPSVIVIQPQSVPQQYAPQQYAPQQYQPSPQMQQQRQFQQQLLFQQRLQAQQQQQFQNFLELNRAPEQQGNAGGGDP